MPPPEVTEKQLPQPLEAVKRFVDSLPEVPLGKTLNRWIKGQSPDGETAAPGVPSHQSR